MYKHVVLFFIKKKKLPYRPGIHIILSMSVKNRNINVNDLKQKIKGISKLQIYNKKRNTEKKNTHTTTTVQRINVMHVNRRYAK